MTSEEMYDHPNAELRFKKPLLNNPPLLDKPPISVPVLPGKKTLLQRPDDIMSLKQPLLGSSPDQSGTLSKPAAWPVIKRSFGGEEMPCPCPAKRQALLPTPGDSWGGHVKVEPDGSQASGLLPHPSRRPLGSPQSGLLPPPTQGHIFMSACHETNNKHAHSAAAHVTAAATPLASGLLPLPGARASNDPLRNNNQERAISNFKKLPLLQTPGDHNTAFPKKPSLFPLVSTLPIPTGTDSTKLPLLKAPPPANRMIINPVQQQQQQRTPLTLREPLIPTPPVFACRKSLPIQAYKKVHSPFQATGQASSLKRALLPTPGLLC